VETSVRNIVTCTLVDIELFCFLMEKLPYVEHWCTIGMNNESKFAPR